MGTTTVKRGAGRASHAERTNRHAQRTPLPPKPGQVEAARAAQDELQAAKSMERLVGHREAASPNGDGTDDRSKAKGAAFAAKAVAAGWEVAKAIVGGTAEVTATRGPETIVIAWKDGVFQYPSSFYGYGDRNTKPRNASGAEKLLHRTPEDAAREASKVASNRHFRKAEPQDLTVQIESARKALPFDPELATDEEISGILAGQALVWYNRLSRGQESAIVGRSGIRITQLPDGQRVITFCCPATGYRSCLVTAILKVGRGRANVTKGLPMQSVAVEVE